MQNTHENGMYYVVRSANLCHYQTKIRTLLNTLLAFEGEGISVKFYNPTSDYSNDFVVVGNTPEATSMIPQIINWNEVKTMIPDEDEASLTSTSSAESSSKKRKRQCLNNYSDFGWTTLTCQTRFRSSNGVAIPRIKPGTNSPHVSNLFCGVSSLIKTITAPWLKSSESIFLDDDEPSRQPDFQEQIGPGNIVEAIRVAKTDVSQLCAAHEDTQNSSKPTMSAVFSLSKIADIKKRFAVIAYGRQSLDTVLEESNCMNPFTKAIIDFYTTVELKHRDITPALLLGVQSSPIEGFPVITNQCNLDPFGYHLTFVELVLRLIQKFNLDLIEIISVITCYEVFPHCLYYFGVAAHTFLLDVAPKHTHRFRGPSFGHKLAQVMMHVFKETRDIRDCNIRSRSSGSTLPATRFHCYTSLSKMTTLPTYDLWEERIFQKLHTVLMFNETYWKTKNQPTKIVAYKSIINDLEKYAPNCGLLTMQHELGIMSAIGLLPLWIFSHATVDFNGKPMKYFQEEFPCIATTDEKKQVSTVTTLNCALNSTSEKTLTIRDNENIVCKAFRYGVRNPKNTTIPKKSKCAQRDLLFPNQCVISFRHDGFTVFNGQGQKSFGSGSLIKKWPCKGQLCDMHTVSNAYTEMMKFKSSMTKYQSGMRPPKNFLRIDDPIRYEYELTCYSYGNANTKDVARRITDLVLFN
jgi:hypothetical protein